MSISKTIDTALVLKALGAEASGTDGAGAAFDMGGDCGLTTVVLTVTAVAGDPPSRLDVDLEASHDLANWYVVARCPGISAPGRYLIPLFGIAAVDQFDNVPTCTPRFVFGESPRYLRKKSVVTAGTEGDGVTYRLHMSA